MGVVRKRIEDYLYIKWDRQGHYPTWATIFYPYIHFCPAMDDLLVTAPEDCYCGHVPEEIKEEARKVWISQALKKDRF